jgi:transcriptional regulator with XRE-family HTH domain
VKFGEALRKCREERGLSRQSLAESSSVPFGTIHGYEDGRRAPSFANVVRLAAALGVSCEAFSACEDVTGEAQAEDPPEEAERARGKRK